MTTHYEDIPREIQKKAFRMQMALAQEVGLPVIIHQREALADCLEILGDFPEVKGFSTASPAPPRPPGN